MLIDYHAVPLNFPLEASRLTENKITTEMENCLNVPDFTSHNGYCLNIHPQNFESLI